MLLSRERHTGPLVLLRGRFLYEGTIFDSPHHRAGAVSKKFMLSLTLPSPQPSLSLSPLLPFHPPPLQPLAAREPLPGAPEALLDPAGPARAYPPGAQVSPQAQVQDHFHGGWATWLSVRAVWKAPIQGAPQGGKPGAVEGGYEQGLQPGVAPGFAFCREKEEAAVDNGQPLLLRVFMLDFLQIPFRWCTRI
jgi:hypothetical protein